MFTAGWVAGFSVGLWLGIASVVTVLMVVVFLIGVAYVAQSGVNRRGERHAIERLITETPARKVDA